MNVQHTGTKDIEDFEDDDWQEMDFYEDTMKTGKSHTFKVLPGGTAHVPSPFLYIFL